MSLNLDINYIPLIIIPYLFLSDNYVIIYSNFFTLFLIIFLNFFKTDISYFGEYKITEFNTSKWIILSSFSYLIPFYYSYIYKIYFYCFLSLITILFSINYWRNPILSLRRDLDIFIVKYNFILFFINKLYYVRNNLQLMIIDIFLYFAISLYFKEEYFYYLNNNCWFIYHMLFHFITSLIQLFILFSYPVAIIN